MHIDDRQGIPAWPQTTLAGAVSFGSPELLAYTVLQTQRANPGTSSAVLVVYNGGGESGLWA